MDPESKELMKAAAVGTAEGATRAFLDRVCGPLVELSEMGRDAIRLMRWKRQVTIFARAEAFLEQSGLPAHTVPPKTLFPLLEFSSLEDDADEAMASRWAALLANAAAGDRGAAVLPSFPRILAELSSDEARILDALYEEAETRPPPLVMSHLPEFQREIGMGEDALFTARLFNLDRLKLVRTHVRSDEIAEGQYVQTVYLIEGTPLGNSFVTACKPPAQSTGARTGAHGPETAP